jgi:hypothetical protein
MVRVARRKYVPVVSVAQSAIDARLQHKEGVEPRSDSSFTSITRNDDVRFGPLGAGWPLHAARA